jgi:hypothetical protein
MRTHAGGTRRSVAATLDQSEPYIRRGRKGEAAVAWFAHALASYTL